MMSFDYYIQRIVNGGDYEAVLQDFQDFLNLKIEYFIGIDFGHGETCVSRVPGYNQDAPSQVPLRLSGYSSSKKIISAVRKNEDGEWDLVTDSEDYKSDSLVEGFKAPISELNKADEYGKKPRKEAFEAFAKLVFNAICKNDDDLKYDPETGECNFVICIANPSGWRNEDADALDEYLSFFRDECGIKPIVLCINESDAAFYTKFSEKTGNDDIVVLVIDMGSSTIDFTAYRSPVCIDDGCWGINLGAHQIEDMIVAYGNKKTENRANIDMVKELRELNEIGGDISAAISLYAREAKEKFFTNDCKRNFRLKIDCANLVPLDNEIAEDDIEKRSRIEELQKSLKYKAFEVNLSPNDFNNLIKDYNDRLESALKEDARKLSEIDVSPNSILLSGGASRMPFVKDLVMKYFPDAKEIKRDNEPEWIVSNGAAKYMQAHHQALVKLLTAVSKIDFASIYKDADIDATQEATKQMLPSVIADITGSKDYNGVEMVLKFAEFFYDLNSDNPKYVSIFRDTANKVLRDKIAGEIHNVISDVFNVDADLSDVNIDFTFDVMNWRPEFWIEGRGAAILAQTISNSTNRYNFTPDKPREQWEREMIAEGCSEAFSRRDPFGVEFEQEGVELNAKKIKALSLSMAVKIFYDKELFRASTRG